MQGQQTTEISQKMHTLFFQDGEYEKHKSMSKSAS